MNILSDFRFLLSEPTLWENVKEILLDHINVLSDDEYTDMNLVYFDIHDRYYLQVVNKNNLLDTIISIKSGCVPDYLWDIDLTWLPDIVAKAIRIYKIDNLLK